MPKLEEIPSFKSGTFKQSNSQIESRSNIMARRQNKRITGIVNEKKEISDFPKRKQRNDDILEFDSDDKNQNSIPERDKLNRSEMSKGKFSSNSEESMLRTSKVNPMELTVQHFKRPSKSEIDDDSIEALAKIKSHNENKAAVNSNNSNNKNLNTNNPSSPSNPKSANNHKNGTPGYNLNNHNTINNQTSNPNNPKDQTIQINQKNQPNHYFQKSPNSQQNAKSSNDSNNSNKILDPPSSTNIIREILQEREREMKKNVESSSKIENTYPQDGKHFQPTEEEQIMLESIKLFFQKIQPNV